MLAPMTYVFAVKYRQEDRPDSGRAATVRVTILPDEESDATEWYQAAEEAAWKRAAEVARAGEEVEDVYDGNVV